MDEKRQFLMDQLFGNANEPPSDCAQQLQKWHQAQVKAEKVAKLLDDKEKAANALRNMMKGEN